MERNEIIGTVVVWLAVLVVFFYNRHRGTQEHLKKVLANKDQKIGRQIL